MADYTVYLLRDRQDLYTAKDHVPPCERAGLLVLSVTGPAMPALPALPITYRELLVWMVGLIDQGYQVGEYYRS